MWSHPQHVQICGTDPGQALVPEQDSDGIPAALPLCHYVQKQGGSWWQSRPRDLRIPSLHCGAVGWALGK